MVVAQLARASDCGSEGRRFEPGLPPHDNAIRDITLDHCCVHFLCDFIVLNLSFLKIFFALYLEFFLL